ncbi:MAG: efflux RND transporter permease subunit [Candidatus Omnitrophica bacterium]|nr:efflux RND transporter permease subunit [Candidatus Omnitrophota bacterium]
MTLADICIKRPVFTVMLISALVVLGIFSIRDLGLDLFPKVDFPIITITTTLRGANPEEVETEVTKTIEEAVNTISGIDELRSTSYEGVSQVVVTFILEKNVDIASQEVRDRIGRILSELPEGTDPPIIEKLDPDASPVMSVTVSSNNRSLRELTYLAKKMVNILDAGKLKAYNLSVTDVKDALRNQNLEVPGGRVDEGNSELVLRTLGRITKVEDFENIIVKQINNVPVRIADMGRVEDTEEEPRSLARLDGNSCLSLSIRKQSGTNTVEVINNVKKNIQYLSRNLPHDVKVEVVRDQSSFIEASVHAIEEHLILGAILTSLVVLIFMGNLRSTIIASIAIPTSLISTFTLMRLMHLTLNNMTLLGLSLTVGIVIDDAIVVLENIFRHIEEKGTPPEQAASEATQEITLAVMATTLSLVIIFLPLAFMGGMVGKFLKSYGLTVAFAIMVSLLISFTLTPSLSARFLKVIPSGKGNKKRRSSKESFFYSIIDRSYGAMLKFSLGHRWVIVLSGILVVLSMGYLMPHVGKDFIPSSDQSEFAVQVKAPEGTSLTAMDKIRQDIENEIRKLRGVNSLLTTIGEGTGAGVNEGEIYVKMVDLKKRKFSQFDVMKDARKALKAYPDLRIAVQEVGAISGGGFRHSLVNFNVRGPELEKLKVYSENIKMAMKTMPGFVDVDTTLNVGKPELKVKIDRDRASSLGVKVSDITSALRTMVGGEEDITKYKEGDELYEVRLRVKKDDRNSPMAIGELFVASEDKTLIRLDNLVSLVEETGPAQIDRQNRQRQVTLLANLDNKPLGYAVDKLNAVVKEMDLPPGYITDFSGRAKVQAEAFRNFAIVFLLSIIFMYMVLGSQFESFLHPITILLSLPLCVPFALFSLLVTNGTLNIFSILGVFMLFGIVKKNAILQIDYTNTLRKRGMERNEAILEANHARLRPILMTTITLVAAMLPVALGKGAGAETRASMTIVIIGGQSLCLLITLLMTPVAYSLFDDIGGLFKHTSSIRKCNA